MVKQMRKFAVRTKMRAKRNEKDRATVNNNKQSEGEGTHSARGERHSNSAQDLSSFQKVDDRVANM